MNEGAHNTLAGVVARQKRFCENANHAEGGSNVTGFFCRLSVCVNSLYVQDYFVLPTDTAYKQIFS